MTAPTLRASQRQQHVVTPRLQHAVRLLQLSSLDFAQEVHDAMGRNPFLEVEDAPPDAGTADAGPLTVNGDAIATEIAPIADLPYERDGWQQSSTSVHTQGGDGDISMLDLIAAEIDLRQNLHSQINVLPLSQRDHALACAIVESLDDDGYLRTPLEELAATSGMDPAVEPEEMQIALRRVQSLEPLGVAARNVSECLQLQLPAIEDPAQRGLARRIVCGHLGRLAQHDVAGLVRELGAPAEEIEAACERIRHLDPRPGWKVGASTTQFITPDVLVRKDPRPLDRDPEPRRRPAGQAEPHLRDRCSRSIAARRTPSSPSISRKRDGRCATSSSASRPSCSSPRRSSSASSTSSSSDRWR